MSEIRVDTISEKTSGSGTTVSNLVNPNSPFRNVIINGDMTINQRGSTSTTGLGADGELYFLDRIRTFTSGTAGRYTLSQDTDVPPGLGFSNSLKFQCTTADTSVAADELTLLQQQIAGENLQGFCKGTSSAKKFTVSFYAKANESRVVSLELSDSDNSRTISQLFTVTADWQRHVLTFDADTTGAFDNDTNKSMSMIFWLHAGSNFTGGTLNTSWNSNTNANRAAGIGSLLASTDNNFYITGWQFEVGDHATDFEHIPRDVNLKRCQRYFYNLSSLGPYVPASEAAYLGAGFYYTSSFVIAMINLPTAMRTEPSLTTSNASNSFMFYRNGEGDNMDDLSLNGSSSAICATVQNNTDVSGTAGHAGGLVVQAGTICNLSAEI
tara:strand:- start:216 stop:1361 length:1146 start_codon:yes stop_codon:yes gene_type:complete